MSVENETSEAVTEPVPTTEPEGAPDYKNLYEHALVVLDEVRRRAQEVSATQETLQKETAKLLQEHVEIVDAATDRLTKTEDQVKSLRARLSTQKAFAFVFVDFTTDATAEALRPAAHLPDIVQAAVEYLATDYAKAYGGRNISFRIASGPTDRQPNEIGINLRDVIPEAPGALAYHTETNGIADIEVGCSLFSTATDGSESLSCGILHEILELLGDEGANGWKDRQDATSGEMDAEELCDFVQNTSKPMSNGVHVSNFVLPSFFVPGSPAPWDNMGVMQSQYDVSNGYGIVASTPTDPHQLQAARLFKNAGGDGKVNRQVKYRGSLTENQKARKSHPYSRTYRRGVRF